METPSRVAKERSALVSTVSVREAGGTPVAKRVPLPEKAARRRSAACRYTSSMATPRRSASTKEAAGKRPGSGGETVTDWGGGDVY